MAPNTRWHVSPLAFHSGDLYVTLSSLTNSFLIFLLGFSNTLQQMGNRMFSSRLTRGPHFIFCGCFRGRAVALSSSRLVLLSSAG